MADVDFNKLRVSLKEDIAEYDRQLDEAQGGDTAGKRKISNALVESTKDSWSKVSVPLIDQLNGIENVDARVGRYLGLVRELNAAFKELADSIIQGKYDAQPKVEQVTIPEDELKAIAAARSEKYSQLKKLTDLVVNLEIVEKDDPDWQLPPVRRANVGKRGKRALNQMTWVIDGNELDPDETTPKDVAEALGFTKKEGTGGSVSGQLTSALKALGIDTTNPGTGFEVEINGHTVVASRETSEPDEVEESEETE